MPSVTKTTDCTVSSSSPWSDPPPGETSMTYCANVVAKPSIGRASTHSRVFSQPGRLLVTMSRSTPRGITVYASVTIARSVSSSVWPGRPPCGV